MIQFVIIYLSVSLDAAIVQATADHVEGADAKRQHHHYLIKRF